MTQKKRSASIPALVVLLVSALLASVSCRANPVASRLKGDASLSLTVGGALPPKSIATGPGASAGVRPVRSVLPTTASIRVTVEDSDGRRTRKTADYASGATVTVENLPSDEALQIEVAALNASGDVLTVWTDTVTLGTGTNSVAATLAPESGAVSTPPSVEWGGNAVDLATDVELPEGGALFMSLPLGASSGGQYQIVFDTGKARWAWMRAYTADWEPLPVVCADEAQGWFVMDVPAGSGSINVALANCVASPGYPSGPLAGTIQARPAVFVAPGAGGSGTSVAPAGTLTTVTDGRSAFISGGTLTLSGAYTISGDVRLYGGFSSGWTQRAGETRILQSSSLYTIIVDTGGSGSFDRLRIGGNEWAGGNTTSGSLMVNTNNLCVVTNCRIEGNISDATLMGSHTSYALYASNGILEVASSSISGGRISSEAGNAATYGIYAVAGTPYIHHCEIDGGSAQAVDESGFTFGIQVFAGARPVIAASRIWGGAVSASGDLAEARSYGIYSASTTGCLVAGCSISGGYSTQGYTYSYGIVSLDTADRIVGNTIDSGRSTSLGARYGYAIDFSNTAAAGVVAGNLLFCSTEYDEDVANGCRVGAFSEGLAGPSRISGNGIFSSNVEMYKSGFPGTIAENSSATTRTPNAVNVALTPASQFRAYSVPTTFAQFLEQDWRPAAGAAIAGTSSGETPAEWSLSADDFYNYPALGFDLAGRARGRTTVWSRGAHQ